MCHVNFGEPTWSKLSAANQKPSRVIDDAEISNYFLYLKIRKSLLGLGPTPGSNPSQQNL